MHKLLVCQARLSRLVECSPRCLSVVVSIHNRVAGTVKPTSLRPSTRHQKRCGSLQGCRDHNDELLEL